MRRIIGLSLAAVLLLAGCGSDTASDSETPTPAASSDLPEAATAEDLAMLDKVTVTGGGEEPFAIELDGEVTVSYPVVKVLREGEGDALIDGGYLMLDGSLFEAGTGEQLNSSFNSPAARIAAENTPDQMSQEVYDALVGKKIGTQLLWIMPQTDAEAKGYIYVLEVVETWEPKERAEGEKVELPAGLPEVTLDGDGKPSVKLPQGEAPTELIVQTLIKGDGPAISPGDLEYKRYNYVTFNYTGWKWTGEQFDSSWDRGSPFSSNVGASQLIKAWDEGLIGQTVGSQVLIIAPPKDAYGVEGSNHELKDDTLVFVLDILNIQ